MLVLTKGEQRVVIIVIMALLGAAFATYYRNSQAHSSLTKDAPISVPADAVPTSDSVKDGD